jgi:hypothetical protein
MFGNGITVHNCYGAGRGDCVKVYGPPVTESIKANSK